MIFLATLLAAVTYITFIGSVWTVFEKVHKAEPMRLTILKIIFLSSSILSTLQIYFSTQKSHSLILLSLGIALFLLSNTIFWWAAHSNRMRKLSLAFSTDVPVHLVKTGPYKYVRHPFYASYILSYLAALLCSQSLIVAIPFIAITTVYVSAARSEEKKFQNSSLSKDYSAYIQTTGRFFPRIRKNKNS